MKKHNDASRRDVLKGAAATAGLAAIGAPFVITSAKAARPLVWVSWGGHTQEVQEQVFIRPFMKETGIEVVATSGPDAAKIKAMVQTGNVEWDVVNLAGSYAMSLSDQNLLEPLDYGVIDAKDLVRPDWVYPKAIGWYYYSGGIGFDPKRTPNPPRNWPDFWNTAKFPGRRAIIPLPDETLEFALLADGVTSKDLYPLDIDRAFKSLDKLKPHIAQFPNSAKSVEVLQRGEVEFDYTYSGRIEIAKANGASVDFVYGPTINAPSFQGIVKGTPNKDAANKLIAYFMRVDRQKAWAEAIGYGPQKKAAFNGLPESVLRKLPSLDSKQAAWVNVEWWSKNREKIDIRFKEWQMS